jgi:serine protease AprX
VISEKFNLQIFIILMVVTMLLLGAFPLLIYPALGNEPASDPVWARKRQTVVDSPVFVHLSAVGTFDPLRVNPDIPDRLTYTPLKVSESSIYIVQFVGPVKPEWRQAIVDAGGQLGDYLPDYAFLAYLDVKARAAVEALSFVRWIGPYQPAYKLAPDVVDTDYEDTRSYRVLLAPWADEDSIRATLNSLTEQIRPFDQGFSAVLDSDGVIQVAHLPDVIWVEPYHLQRLYNDVGGGAIMDGSTAWGNGYTGSNVAIAVADTGLDTGNADTMHQDFYGRVAHISSWPVVYANYGGGCEIANAGSDDGPADVDSGHGTHVAGSVAGSGAASGGQFKGLGYEATVTFQAVEQWTEWSRPNPSCLNGYYLTGIPNDVRDLLNEAYNWGVRVHNNSWGGGQFGIYDQQSAQFDDFIHQHQDMNVIVAAGNAGTDSDGDGYVDENSTTSPATAKNVLTVGASENERSTGGYQYTWGQAWPQDYPADPTWGDHLSDNREHLAAFSSRGPLADGRIKPDVVAPGTNILSVRSSQADYDGWGMPYNQYYMYMGGTSMASPLAAGATTLVRDYYLESEGYANPSAALIKATLINSAVDIEGYGNGAEEAGQPIPNNHEGWGRVDVGAATTPGERQFVDDITGISTGDVETYQYNVKQGQPFKVTLAWSDSPGSPAASKALVNDVNLCVIAPDGTTVYRGNYFSGGWSQPGGSADSTNNVENVYVETPSSGWWTVEVVGHNIPQGPQLFALVVDGDVSLSEDLTVTSIDPTRGPNNGVLANVVIQGTGFGDNLNVDLIYEAEVIPGTDLNVDPEADTIITDFNLNGATPGMWDVQVTNADGVTATLENALQVLDATLPDLSVSKVTEERIIGAGNWLTYTITIGNIGYGNATGVTFTDTLSSGLVFERLSPACGGGTSVLPNGFACLLQPTSLSAGAEVSYTLVVSVSSHVSGTLVNRVRVGSLESDGNLDDNEDEAAVRVGGGIVYLPLVLKQWPEVVPPTPTPTPTATPTVTPTGSPVPPTDTPSPNTIQNGDFENGRDGSWTEYSANGFPLIVDLSPPPPPVPPYSGKWQVWLGGANNEICSITQQVTVPSVNTTLSFWHWIGSQEDTCGNDVGQVLIDDVSIEIFDLCASTGTSGWVKYTTDLSDYAGQLVSLKIRAETDDSQNSNWFIDDVAFE